jgi:hypothetical protein
MQYNFGMGLMSFIPSGSNPTPVQCGVLQEVSVDIDQTIKELRGQYKFPVDLALADGKISGSSKFAQIYGRTIGSILSGSVTTTGSKLPSINELGTVPAAPAYTVTVANSATFTKDWGVIDVTTGLQMVRVASAPATGQYAVTSGVYTFAAADASHVVWISYQYSSASGKTVEYSNQLMGAANTFTLDLFNVYNSKYLGITLYAAVFPKLSYSMKNTEYTEQNLDFMAYANTSGQVIGQYSSE